MHKSIDAVAAYMEYDEEAGFLKMTFDHDDFYGQFDRLEDEAGYAPETREQIEAMVYDVMIAECDDLSQEAADRLAHAAIAHVLDPAVHMAEYARQVLSDEPLANDVTEDEYRALIRSYCEDLMDADWSVVFPQIDGDTGLDTETITDISERYAEIRDD